MTTLNETLAEKGFPFKEIWLVDFEYSQLPGERVQPLCMVAIEYYSGKRHRMWRSELFANNHPPFSVGPDTLFVAYYASASPSCDIVPTG